MESWIQAIVEWINCLGIYEQPISHLQQLQDNQIFYTKIIKQLKQIDTQSNIDNDLILKFIEEEYPEIILSKNENVDHEIEEVYIVSLILLSASQKVSFHRPMYTLKNETQILIKRFLELILPYGKDVTLDIIRDTIMELNDTTSMTPPQTPKDRPLRNFLTSPAAHSAYRHKILNERTRELRVLKAQLETEKFEKADLHEDIQILEDKVKNLQKKLQCKTEELKALRAEKTLSATPKSARKTKNDGNIEQHLRKEIEHLELFNTKLQGDLERLENDHENLTRRFTSKERENNALQQKVDEYEREMENLSIQMEIKSNELLDLRMHNEELRAHIKGMQKHSIDTEQSFEVDNVSRARSPFPGINNSEAASSIIEIQLRESNEESARLKIELNNIQEKLDLALEECNELKLQNELLNEKIINLDEIQMALEIAEDKLSKRDCQLNIIEMEKQSLQTELKSVKTKITESETEVLTLKKELNNLKIALVTTEDTLAQNIATKEVLNMKVVSLEEKINSLEKSLTAKTQEFVQIKEISENKIYKLEHDFKMCSDEKHRLEQSIIQKDSDFEQVSADRSDKISEINVLKSNALQLEHQLSLNQTLLSETENKLCELNELRDELQSQVRHERETNYDLMDKIQYLECKLSDEKTTNNKLLDQISMLQLNLNELQKKYTDLHDKAKLDEEKHEKNKEEIESLHSEKEKLITASEKMNTQISELKNIQENLENRIIQEQEYSMKLLTEKTDLEHNIAMIRCEIIDKSEKISMLQAQLEETKEESNQNYVKYNKCNQDYTEANEKSRNLEVTVVTLNSEIDELKKKIFGLEEIEKNLKSELKISEDKGEALSLEKIELDKAILSRDDEKKKLMTNITALQTDLEASRENIVKLNADYTTLQQKHDNHVQNIESLNKEMEMLNGKIREITDERNLLQTKVNDMTKELKIHEAKSQEMQLEIDQLRQISVLMVDSHQDQQNTSNELIGSLEKRLSTTQETCESLKMKIKEQEETLEEHKSKLEKMTNNKIESESKLKEIIDNLKEVRSSQDAVLEVQVKALNNKTVEFDILKAQYQKMKEEFQSERELQKAYSDKLFDQCSHLKEITDKNIKVIQELEQSRNEESKRAIELEEKYNLMETDMKVLDDICTKLQKNNYEHENSIDTISISFNYPTTEKLVEIMKDMRTNIETNNQTALKLYEQNNSLKTDIEENKAVLATELENNKKNADLLVQINAMDIEWNRRNLLLTDLIRKKEELQSLLKEAIMNRDELEDKLSYLHESWNTTSCKVKKNIAVNSSVCDELKHIEAKTAELERLLTELDDRHSKNLKPLIKVLCRVFMWSEKKINEIYTVPLTKNDVNILDIDLSDEVSVLQAEIKAHEIMQKDIIQIQDKINDLRNISDSYELNIKSGIVKRESTTDEKLKIQLDKVTQEKKELKDKMDLMRVRNAKLEKNMDELRNENKKLQAQIHEITSKNNIEIEQLKAEIVQLTKNVEILKKEKAESEKRPKEEEFDAYLKDIHNEYGEKLEKIKQKMKVAYTEQIAKLNAEQEKTLSVKVEALRNKMEQQCKKYSEDIAKYKAHISDMSAQFWDVGEKLLAEKQEKETAIQHLRELQRKNQIAISEANQSIQSEFTRNQMNPPNIGKVHAHDRANIPPRSSFRGAVMTEELTTTAQRHSVRSIQAMGNAFSAEDEEGEVFDNVYLADLKEGKFRTIDSAPDFDRISELRMRNSLCRPHLRSAYAVETHLHPHGLTEEDIKNGVPNDDTFNDSLSQSLLPGQKPKKKDRTQTSYKKPGPPTPSKNGGRLSLQGNELKSPNLRILREKNSERRTTATPKRLKDFFGSTLSRRQDENAPATPKGRRLSNIFRKTRQVDKS